MEPVKSTGKPASGPEGPDSCAVQTDEIHRNTLNLPTQSRACLAQIILVRRVECTFQ